MVIGHAAVTRRRTPTWPARWAAYFDCTPWGGGYVRIQGARGAVVLSPGVLLDLRTGEVYQDERFQ